MTARPGTVWLWIGNLGGWRLSDWELGRLGTVWLHIGSLGACKCNVGARLVTA